MVLAGSTMKSWVCLFFSKFTLWTVCSCLIPQGVSENLYNDYTPVFKNFPQKVEDRCILDDIYGNCLCHNYIIFKTSSTSLTFVGKSVCFYPGIKPHGVFLAQCVWPQPAAESQCVCSSGGVEGTVEDRLEKTPKCANMRSSNNLKDIWAELGAFLPCLSPIC